MFRRLVPVVLLVGIFVLGCSDSGDMPTMPDGNDPSLLVSNDKVLEGESVSFTVSLTGTTGMDVIFSYTTSDGDALAGSDYTAVYGVDTVTAGSSSATIVVATVNNLAVEFAEDFQLVISSPVNAVIGDSIGVATIYDEDGVRFSTQVFPLLQNRCAASGCHGTGAGRLYVDSYNSVTGSNSVVSPRNADASSLYLKLLDPPPFGRRMPLDGPYLSSGEINTIRDWIDQDAQDN